MRKPVVIIETDEQLSKLFRRKILHDVRIEDKDGEIVMMPMQLLRAVDGGWLTMDVGPGISHKTRITFYETDQK